MRRLPIYLVIDVSESMAGDNLRGLQDGMELLLRTLRTDPHALETVYLSVIAFAGRAKTLTPLVELPSFYPPRLPLGSGTSIGAALEHLMNEIASQVRRSVPGGEKGDWKPLVFFMTDGKATDDTGAAVRRWKQDFAMRAHLVVIGIGKYAAVEALAVLTPDVLRLENTDETALKKYIQWISASIGAQSRSVGIGEPARVSLAKLDESFLKKIEGMAQANAVDEDFVVVTGKCQNTKLPYLMKYERQNHSIRARSFHIDSEGYHLVGVYPAERDFDALSDPRANVRTVNSDLLIGTPGCPHCGNPIAFAMCSCGTVFCVQGAGTAQCPGCERELEMSASDEAFDVVRGRG